MWVGIKYDPCAVRQDLRQSEGPGQYSVGTPAIRETCLPASSRIISQRGADSQPWNFQHRFYTGPVDVESDLRNIDRPATDCPSKKYDPRVSNCGCENQGQPGGAGVINGCSYTMGIPHLKQGQRCGDFTLQSVPICDFGVEDTRLSNPASNLRGTGVNRFNPLCLDPQANLFFPGAIEINSRLLCKDNHRPCVPNPAVNSMAPPLLPLPCDTWQPTKTAPTAPLYQFDVFG